MKKFYKESELVFEEKPVNRRFEDLEGQKFNKLTVIGFAGRENRQTSWFCKCECGNIKKVLAGGIKSGVTSSCGCFHIEQTIKASTVHGHAKKGNPSPTYSCWQHMMSRCQNPNAQYYSDYGGRGITVCKRWEKFENFLEDMGERPKGKSIDRRENNKGYYKENCRWATMKEQQNNRRSNHCITFNGKTQNITQWAEEIGVKSSTLFVRINMYKWTIERALTTPTRKLNFISSQDGHKV